MPTAATRRDIEDPATAELIAEIVGDRETLDLLAALTEADATATGPTAWTQWRAGLVRGLVRKAHEWLDASTVSPDPEEYAGWTFDPVELNGRSVVVRRIEHHTGSLLSIVARDRPGLLSDLAAGVALAGLRVRSVRTGGDDIAATLWEVAGDDVDEGRLERLLRQVLDGTIEIGDRLAYAPDPKRPVPAVTVLRDQSATSSLVEVRADAARGLLWLCCRVIATQGCTIRSTHATSIGPQADNVFYVVDADDEPLSDQAMDELARTLRKALCGG